MGVRSVRIASLPPHRRPRITRRAAYRLLWGPLHALATGAGLALALAASRTLCLLLASALAAAWLRRRFVRSGRYQKRLIRAAYVELCKQDPGTPREELLSFLIQARHPRWDPEMIGQMISDHPTVDGLLDSLVRLERQIVE